MAQRSKPSFVDRMLKIDRRIIFLLIALAVIIPMLLNLVFVVRPSTIVQLLFDKVENLPPGSKVLMSFDYGPSTVPENRPMGEATLRHCLVKGHVVYIMALWATGEAEANITITNVIRTQFPDKVYGEDYIQLGYKAGSQGLINAIFTDLKGMYTTDAEGMDINQFPMMEGIVGLRDFDLILGICSGKPGIKEWVQFAGDRGDIPIGGGVTAVEAPLLYPYWNQDTKKSQVVGFMGGLQGAAEYEAAVVRAYPQYREIGLTAVKLMGPQTIAHLVIIFFVVVGNIAFFLKARQARKAKQL